MGFAPLCHTHLRSGGHFSGKKHSKQSWAVRRDGWTVDPKRGVLPAFPKSQRWLAVPLWLGHLSCAHCFITAHYWKMLGLSQALSEYLLAHSIRPLRLWTTSADPHTEAPRPPGWGTGVGAGRGQVTATSIPCSPLEPGTKSSIGACFPSHRVGLSSARLCRPTQTVALLKALLQNWVTPNSNYSLTCLALEGLLRELSRSELILVIGIVICAMSKAWKDRRRRHTGTPFPDAARTVERGHGPAG